MRLSTNSMYQKNLNSILNTNTKWQKSGLQLATGKRILSPSDDPMGTAQALILKQTQSRNNQFQAARESVDISLGRQDTVLKEANTVMQSIKETLVYAGNETLSDGNRRDLANTLQGLKDQLVSLANAQNTDGNYLFAGNKNDTPPFVVDPTGKVNYVGGSTTINVFIDETREVALSFTGDKVFLSGYNTTAETDVFASIDYAIEVLAPSSPITTEQFRDGLSKASQGVDNSFDNISTVRATGGNVLNEVERLIARNNGHETQIGQIEDVDWYEAISNYVMLQANLQAAQYTFMSMQNMSLFQMK